MPAGTAHAFGRRMEVRKLPGRAWQTAWDATHLFVDDQGLSWAGAIGLYLFLSVPPAMVAVSWAGRLVTSPDASRTFVVELVGKYVPTQRELLDGIVAHSPESAAAAVGSVALLLFSGSRAFAALTSAINVLWLRVDRLTFWLRQGLRLGMLAVALVLIGLSALAEGLVASLGSNGASETDIWLLDWQLIPMVVLGAMLFTVYKVLPREPVNVQHAVIGAVLATLGVRLAQAGLGYIAETGLFETPYGELAAVALMATWALVVGTIVLYGAAVVAILHGKRPEEEKKTERRFTRARAG
jgi:membrane protein